MRVLVFYAWGNDNAGDKAISAGSIRCLRTAFPQAEIYIVSVFGAASAEFAQTRSYLLQFDAHVHLLPSDLFDRRLIAEFNILDRLAKAGLLALSMLFPRILAPYLQTSHFGRGICQADLVILNAGHLIFWDSIMGEKRSIVCRYLLPLYVARQNAKTYCLHAQSFGPFRFNRSRISGWFAAHALRSTFRGAHCITVRDTQSRQALSALIANATSLPFVLDPAFFIASKATARTEALLTTHQLRDKPFAAITLRFSARGSQKSVAPPRRNRFLDIWVQVISTWLDNHDEPLLLVCQVPRDYEDSLSVVNHLPDRHKVRVVLVNQPFLPEELIEIYGHAKVVIGMRFHSLVFAIRAGVSVAGVYYSDTGPKIKGLFDVFGIPEQALCIDTAGADELLKCITAAWDDAVSIATLLDTKLVEFRKLTINTIASYKPNVDRNPC